MAKRVLIIDDDTGIRKITQIALKAIAAWEVIEAVSGQTGLDLAEAEQPDAILLDVMMPGMDGIATLHHLKANPKTNAIPVILLTAKVQVSEQQEFATLPIAGIIVKPFKAPDIVRQIRLCLGWHD